MKYVVVSNFPDELGEEPHTFKDYDEAITGFGKIIDRASKIKEDVDEVLYPPPEHEPQLFLSVDTSKLNLITQYFIGRYFYGLYQQFSLTILLFGGTL